MSDLRTLNDAFAELERRADAAATGLAPATRPHRALRLVPVAATVVAVAGLVAGAIWLVPGDSGTQSAGPPTTSVSAPSSTTPRSSVPATPEDLIARFRDVLGDTATFEVTDKATVPQYPPSSTGAQETASVVTPDPDAPTSGLVAGTLTSAGVTGSFDLWIRPTDSEPDVECDSRIEDCVGSTLPDGSRLVTGTGRVSPRGVLYLACLKRPDGTTILLHVSNQASTDGVDAGKTISPQPPLTLDQLKAIVTSDKW